MAGRSSRHPVRTTMTIGNAREVTHDRRLEASMRRWVFIFTLLVAGLCVLPVACGSDGGGPDDGGNGDSTLGDGGPTGDGGPFSDGNGGNDSSLFGDGNPNCTPLGISCKTSGDCC